MAQNWRSCHGPPPESNFPENGAWDTLADMSGKSAIQLVSEGEVLDEGGQPLVQHGPLLVRSTVDCRGVLSTTGQSKRCALFYPRVCQVNET